MKKILLLSVSLALLIGLNACKTGKKAYESGNYYQSVLLSVDKLRSSPKNKKAQASLVQAYPLAVQTLELNNENLLKSNDASKWKLILANYGKINRMYEEILRSPKALELIGTPKNYYAEIEKVKKNAAEETYAQALSYLLKGNREDAKRAYYLFQESQSYIPNYKDTNEKIEEARIMATLYVMINQDPVPATFAVSGGHFKNKIDEYLHSSEARMDFIEFYTPEEMITLGIQPSHEVVLRYQDFSIGNVYFKESTEQLTRDSVIVATYTRETPAGTTINNEPLGSGAVPKSGSMTNTNTSNVKNGGNNSNDNNNSGNKKVVICHKPDAQGKGQTLEVSASALQAHLDHGDSMGACEDGGGNNTGDNGNSGSTGNTGSSGSDGNNSNTGNSGGTTGASGTSGNTGSSPNSGNTSSSGTSNGTPGNTGSNGNDNPATTTTPTTEVVNVYATVKATLVVNEKTVTSNALMAMTIYETNRAGRVIKEELFPVEHVWVSKWGYFNGDERALSPEQLEITTQKELPAPSRDATFMMLSEDFYYKVTEALRAFYKNY